MVGGSAWPRCATTPTLFQFFVSTRMQRFGIARRPWRRVRRDAIHHAGTPHFTPNSSAMVVPAYRRFGFVPRGLLISAGGVITQPMPLNLAWCRGSGELSRALEARFCRPKPRAGEASRSRWREGVRACLVGASTQAYRPATDPAASRHSPACVESQLNPPATCGRSG